MDDGWCERRRAAGGRSGAPPPSGKRPSGRSSTPPRATAATVPATPSPQRDRNGRVRVTRAEPPRGHDEGTHRSHVAAACDRDLPGRLCGRTARVARAAGKHALGFRSALTFSRVEPVVAPGAGETITARAARDIVIKGAHELVDVTESRYAPGERGPDPHVHHRHADAFYVLAGELTFGLGPDVTPVDRSCRIARHRAARPRAHLRQRERRRRAVPQRPRAERGVRADPAACGATAATPASANFDQYDPPADGGRPLSDAIVRPARRGGLRRRPARALDRAARRQRRARHLALAQRPREPLAAAAPPPAPRRVVLRRRRLHDVHRGRARARRAGRHVRARPAGHRALVRVHGGEATTFLSAHTPSCGFGDFVRGLAAARTDDDLRAVRERFDQVPAA